MLYLKKYIKNKEVFIKNLEKRNKNIQARKYFEVLEKYLKLKNKLELALNKKNICTKKIQKLKEKNSEWENIVKFCKELNNEIKCIGKYLQNLEKEIIKADFDIPCLLDGKVENQYVIIFDNLEKVKLSFDEICKHRGNNLPGLIGYPFSQIQDYINNDINELLYKKGFEKIILTNNESDNYFDLMKGITLDIEDLPKRVYYEYNGSNIKIIGLTKENDNQKEFDFFYNIINEIINNYNIKYKVVINKAQETSLNTSIEYLYRNSSNEKLGILSNISDYLSYQNGIKYQKGKEKQYIKIIQLTIDLKVLWKEYIVNNLSQDYRINIEQIKSYKGKEIFI
ncbi:MAG: hypothetical protein V3575_01045 [Candidatus Absconditabacteria bacterium]